MITIWICIYNNVHNALHSCLWALPFSSSFIKFFKTITKNHHLTRYPNSDRDVGLSNNDQSSPGCGQGAGCSLLSRQRYSSVMWMCSRTAVRRGAGDCVWGTDDGALTRCARAPSTPAGCCGRGNRSPDTLAVHHTHNPVAEEADQRTSTCPGKVFRSVCPSSSARRQPSPHAGVRLRVDFSTSRIQIQRRRGPEFSKNPSTIAMLQQLQHSSLAMAEQSVATIEAYQPWLNNKQQTGCRCA